MLGLGLNASGTQQARRPLWMWDNKYQLDFDGSTEGLIIARDSSMITNTFTIGIWVGLCEPEYTATSSAGNTIFGNMDASAFEITH